LPPTTIFLAGLVVFGVVLAYDYLFVDVYLVAEWDVTRSDWLFVLSTWLLASFGVAPLVQNPSLANRYWERLRERPGTLLGLAVVTVFALVGTVGAALTTSPSVNFLYAYQPPAFTSVEADLVNQCVGPMTDGRCHGTLQYPLGTDGFGYGVLRSLVEGTHTSVYVAVIAGALVVPLGTLVGAVAGYYGGTTDTLLMRYVDVQQTIPAVVVYIVLILVVGKSLFLLVLVFGLFSWGGVARIVRSEILQRRDAEYVVAARNVGGDDRYILRRHLVPNVSHAAVMTLSQQLPVLLVTEAAVAYLGLGDPDLVSWGTLIARGVNDASATVFEQWWVSLFGVAALAGTVAAFKFVGDSLRDVLDPHED